MQMRLDLGDPEPAVAAGAEAPVVPTPGQCAHELSVAQSGPRGEPHSLCGINGSEIWTNCRAWGRCTMRGDVFGHMGGDER